MPPSVRCHGISSNCLSTFVQAQLQHDSTLRTLLSVYLPQHTLASQAIKAQFNIGKLCKAFVDRPACRCGLVARTRWRSFTSKFDIATQSPAGGGASFPMHFDSDETVDGRRLSAIFYLNPFC